MHGSDTSGKCLSIAGLLACAAMISACSGTPGKQVPSGSYGPLSAAQPTDNTPGSLDIARRMLGTPYRYGGASPDGFDCSGLVYYAYRQTGLDIPRTTVAQYRQSLAVSRKQLQPGDLVFFRLHNGKVSHVGIYAGDGMFIHAPSDGKRVSYASLEAPFWKTHLIGFRRFN